MLEINPWPGRFSLNLEQVWDLRQTLLPLSPSRFSTLLLPKLLKPGANRLRYYTGFIYPHASTHSTHNLESLAPSLLRLRLVAVTKLMLMLARWLPFLII